VFAGCQAKVSVVCVHVFQADFFEYEMAVCDSIAERCLF
jgi:hypothetical protein